LIERRSRVRFVDRRLPVPNLRPQSVLDWDGPLSPPRRNGELVFDALWESRVFGMTMTLYERGAFQWNEFRDRLIATIAAWEATHDRDDPSYRYWDCWLAAFESLVADTGLCAPHALDARVAELAARPAGHDHRRDP
jgi:nitrile hydratase accessory protein